MLSPSFLQNKEGAVPQKPGCLLKGLSDPLDMFDALAGHPKVFPSGSTTMRLGS